MRRILAVVVAFFVLGSAGAYAVFSHTNVNLYVALNSWFTSDTQDLTMSLHASSAALRDEGMTDSSVRALGLPGVTTVELATTALNQIQARLQINSGGNSFDTSKIGISLTYGEATVVDLRLIDRILYVSSHIKDLPHEQPLLVAHRDIERATSSVGDTLPLVSHLLKTLLSGTPASLSLRRDTSLGALIDKEIDQEIPSQTPVSVDGAQKFIVDALRQSSTISGDGSDSTGKRYLLSIHVSTLATKLHTKVHDQNLEALEPYRTEIEKTLAHIRYTTKDTTFLMRFWAHNGTLKRMDVDISSFINVSNPQASLKTWAVSLEIVVGNEVAQKPDFSVDVTTELEPLLSLLS